ncbi:dihydrolipoamide dehydrogenase [Flavobacterium covae]|nr:MULTISPECIES: DUF2911 domain-containing protein [Flavobacterium]OXA82958.1 dihydrolipoamide dehydrogenase [Flavobacterium columnare NBRC 100251 = ATCC 23463]AMA48846.1 dihydrolipoamide dehydrogenase [Flavobacterium covae]AND65021.1 dihydrolipoamide dehydrogenase [Flavobacterium covae]MCH4830811.1 DUF2911 domain-containing protein [Flavobacterium columnare]MCH4833251.1 DUF2911 domain-containing protein [Flavobacterium columnare]
MRFIIKATIFLGSLFAQAQIKVPQASPKALFTQTVGLTEVEIEYSRPSVKGRIIYGDLVPFGKIWRAGANANTTINFSDDVIINGGTLKKGKYALYVMPKAEEWEIYFYNDTQNWGTPEKWDETKIALKASSKTEILHKSVETFTIGISNIDFSGANLEFLWEKTSVSLHFEVPTNKIAIASIEKTLNGPTSGDYFAASQYYYNTNTDFNKALLYINKAYEMNEKKPFWYMRLKSQIQAKLGDYKGAVETAKNSLEGAKLANNLDYIKMNEESIKEWTKR